MAIVFALILAAIFVYYLLKPTPNSRIENELFQYQVAAAGNPRHYRSTALVRNNIFQKNLIFNGRVVNHTNYETFIVDGESMAGCGIHANDGILVDKHINKNEIEAGEVVVYEVDKDRLRKNNPETEENDHSKFKVRQLLGYIQIDNDDNKICDFLGEKDSNLKEENFRVILKEKLKKARDYGIRNGVVTITVTTLPDKGGKKDYSVHTLQELYGVVRYIISRDQIVLAA